MKIADIGRLVARLYPPDDVGTRPVALKTEGFLAARQPGSDSKARLRLRVALEPAKFFMRRALEVAIYQADFAERSQRGPISDDLVKVAQLAKRASDALAALIDAIDPHAGGPRDLELSVLTASDDRDARSPRRRHFTARQHAKHIWRARHVCGSLATSLGRRDGRLRKDAENPGKPEDRAFVEIIAEAWVVLFGEKPSTSLATQNPFLQFTKLAWEDAFDANEAPALTGAVRSLNFSDERVALLLASGPTWI